MVSNVGSSSESIVAYRVPSRLHSSGICGAELGKARGWFQIRIGELIWWDRSRLGKKTSENRFNNAYNAYGLSPIGASKWWLRELNLGRRQDFSKFTWRCRHSLSLLQSVTFHLSSIKPSGETDRCSVCLLYTSDAADE